MSVFYKLLIFQDIIRLHIFEIISVKALSMSFFRYEFASYNNSLLKYDSTDRVLNLKLLLVDGMLSPSSTLELDSRPFKSE